MSRFTAGTLLSVGCCFAVVSLMSRTRSAVVWGSSVTGTGGGRSGACTGELLLLWPRLSGPVERRPLLDVGVAVVRQVVVGGLVAAREPDLRLARGVGEELAQHLRAEGAADDERVQAHGHETGPALPALLVQLVELVLPPLEHVARVLPRRRRHLMVRHPDAVAAHHDVALLGPERVRQVLVDRPHVVAVAELGDERQRVMVRPLAR